MGGGGGIIFTYLPIRQHLMRVPFAGESGPGDHKDGKGKMFAKLQMHTQYQQLC